MRDALRTSARMVNDQLKHSRRRKENPLPAQFVDQHADQMTRLTVGLRNWREPGEQRARCRPPERPEAVMPHQLGNLFAPRLDPSRVGIEGSGIGAHLPRDVGDHGRSWHFADLQDAAGVAHDTQQ
jgi:hypothetical protein